MLDAFKCAGYRIEAEDEYNWLMARGDNDVPISIPKKGRRVAVGIVDTIVHNPFTDSRLRAEILKQISLDAVLPDPPEAD